MIKRIHKRFSKYKVEYRPSINLGDYGIYNPVVADIKIKRTSKIFSKYKQRYLLSRDLSNYEIYNLEAINHITHNPIINSPSKRRKPVGIKR